MMTLMPQVGHDVRLSTLKSRVLLIDDDVEMCAMMTQMFSRRGLQLEAVHDGRRGLDRALSGAYSFVLLDVSMPGLDGLELLRLLRRKSEVPVIMLTGRGGCDDRVVGLDSGADDYLSKPFDTEDLFARMRAVMRRVATAPAPSNEISLSGLRLSSSTRSAFVDGVDINLTSYEFDVLACLVRLAGRVVSRDELTAAIYQRRAMPRDRALDMHISHVRRKLGRLSGLVRTVRGAGFFVPAEGVDAGAGE